MSVCFDCNGSGVRIVCIDDMCHAADECLHGDGMAICRFCEGDGFIPDSDEYIDEMEGVR
jgi:hypothetical protein